MTLRLTVQERDGSTQVVLRFPDVADPEPYGPPLPFTSPLATPDLEELRFYPEGYAQLPVGEYAVRGERVGRECLSAWGEALYSSIFLGDPRRGKAYRQAVECGELVEIALSSNDPKFLALPWELMKAPGEDEPRPLFQYFERNQSAVQIEVLRPPSFEELQQRLKAANEAGTPYHAVHFDGHGMFEDFLDGAGRQGFVIFEREDGYPKFTPSATLTALMKPTAQVVLRSFAASEARARPSWPNPLPAGSPPALVAGLKGQGALPAGFSAAEGQLKSVGASIYYSLQHLPEVDRRRPVILSLFKETVSVIILEKMDNAPARFQGLELDNWDALLDRVSDVGLLTRLGIGLYRLHPALPPYLGALWQSQT